KGECLTVVGPSGAGKSVLLKSLNRLIEPSEGKIELFGTNIARIDPIDLRRRVCLVGQVPVMFVGTVRENLAYPFSFKRNQSLKRPDYPTILDSVGLSQSLLERDASKLSVGEQQRVAIARALCLSPEILLLDEPTAPLDHASVEVVVETITHLNCEMELTIVMVTHDTDQASRLGDETLRIVDGRVDGNME
ncbi:MAG: ATP-binding cassette domain-containing protein, partial [Euryarchaeota archaeon]|nr:ATP-binding cassette domain-containing protein [Euryarchaeota archaeon]